MSRFDLDRRPGAQIIGGRKVSPEVKAVYDDLALSMFKLQGEAVFAERRMHYTDALVEEGRSRAGNDPWRNMLLAECVMDFRNKARQHQARLFDYGL